VSENGGSELRWKLRPLTINVKTGSFPSEI
jgi:hypothetical protein